MWSMNWLPIRGTRVHHGFKSDSCSLIFTFLCSVLYVILCPFSFWSLCCMPFDWRFLTTPLVSSNFSLHTKRRVSLKTYWFNSICKQSCFYLLLFHDIYYLHNTLDNICIICYFKYNFNLNVNRILYITYTIVSHLCSKSWKC
jgi:hypothetical protein